MNSDNYAILVNKQHRLPASYLPKNLTLPLIPFDAAKDDPKHLLEYRTAQAAESLFAEARNCKLHLFGISGYRSYQRQEELYLESKSGYVAPPGASEHQTGLALDVSCPSIDLDLTEEFAHTPEGIWLHRNAYLYGFILRYPKDKEKVTGYAYEPWHIRYVTKSLSIYLSITGLTLEEYYCSI